MKKLPAVLLMLTASAHAAPMKHFPTYDRGFAVEFQSPSGNLLCQGDYEDEQGKTSQAVFCFDRSLPEREPHHCDLDWTDTVSVAARGKAKRDGLCHGDIVVAPDAKILPYGKTVRGKGWQCQSRTDGIRCTNRDRHGFHIRRGKSILF